MLRHFWLVVYGRGSSGAEPSYMAAPGMVGRRMGRLPKSEGLATSGKASLLEILSSPH